MRIEELLVDRFGGLDHRLFAEISGHVNVFVGSSRDRPQLAQFVRWMLLGRATNYAAAAGHALGSVTVTDRQRRATFTRQCEETFERVTSTYGTLPGNVDGAAELARWLGQVTPAEFDLFCMPGLDRVVRIQDLLAACESRGVDLAGTRIPTTRLQDLRLRADETRRRRQQLPWRGQDLTSLLDRQRIQQQRLHGLELEIQHRRDDVSLEFEQLGAQIVSAEQDIARRREALRRLDDEITQRRADLDSVWQEAQDDQRELISQRRRDLSDIESHLLRARDMLSEIQQRKDAVHDRLEQCDERPGSQVDHAEATLFLVESLARQLDQMCLSDDPDHAGTHGNREADRRPREPVKTSRLAELRVEVGRLCRTLHEQRELGRRQLHADEAAHLRQSASVLHRWVHDLTRQRDQLLDEIDQAERHGVSRVSAEDLADFTTTADRPRALNDVRRNRAETPTYQIRAVAHTCDEITPLHPREDQHLQSLWQRRESEDRALMNVEANLRQWIERRRDLEGQRWLVRDRELDDVRRDLQELDSLIRAAEDRQRLERELRELEAEIADCQEPTSPSTLARHAGEVLSRLTQGEMTALRITDGVGVQVQSPHSGWLDVEQLPGPRRTEVYLSVLLAVVTAVRSRGIDLPLFLETSYLEWDSGAPLRFASEIEAVARQGHQVFVLAADDEFARRLIERGARRFDVKPPRAEAMPPVELPPSVDSVRFRPHGVPREANQFRRAADRHANGWHPPDAVPGTTPRPWRLPPTHSTSDRNNGQFTHHAQLGSVGIVPPEIASRLWNQGVCTVGEFLACSAVDMEREVAGWGVRAPQLQQWQCELGLCAALPQVGPVAARTLVAAGVRTVQQLAATRASRLWRRLQELVLYSDERSYAARPALPSRSQLADWLHAARRLYPEYHPSFISADRDITRPLSNDPSLASGRRRRRRREVRSELRPAPRRRPVPMAEDSPQDLERRPQRTMMEFYLHLKDDVVNAPSIGPKTAERLRDVGVTTVAEFLAAEPKLLAEQLDHRRLTSTVIAAWQAQARLACRIPNLRGHDAQVLVACEITTVEELAQLSPQQLWDRIRPFLKTSECKRIIRNGKTPDEHEVAEWSRSAEHARSLQAA